MTASYSQPQYHSEKFQPLNLSALWQQAAGHVDYQLSNPQYVHVPRLGKPVLSRLQVVVVQDRNGRDVERS